MRIILLFLFLHTFSALNAQNKDVIERDYFPNARAKNAAVAAARYAEEAYFYTKFTSYISAVDSSRMFADTALFFLKRATMIADSSLFYAPAINYAAVEFLHSGINKAESANKVIRGYYPMIDIKSHNVFGREAALNLSNSVMEFYNASLLLDGESIETVGKGNQYEVLPYSDEVVRLEADETAFQLASNAMEAEIKELENLSLAIQKNIAKATNQKRRFALRQNLEKVNKMLVENTSVLTKSSHQIEEIRQLLSKKHLEDVKDVEQPEHLSYFETTGSQNKIEMDKDVPDGLVYKIQLGYYPTDVDIDNFHGLFPISGETVRENLARYFAGLFYSLKEASVGNDYVRNNAIANAFIVPFQNGNKISISTAVEIERERGVR